MAAPIGGSPSGAEAAENDIFKRDFKYYKSRKPPPDMANVVDFETSTSSEIARVCLEQPPGLPILACLKPVAEWRVSKHRSFPGFTIISGAFRAEYQSYWVKRCLEDYPLKPNLSNLDAHMNIEHGFSIWHESLRQRKAASHFSKTLVHKLRWVTLGYHHDWNTKKYSSDNVTPVPLDLHVLSRYIALCLGWQSYNAEAAIINYYHLDSTLAGHTDHSELDHHAPLLSISFGQTALFMLGGPTKETKPMTMYLRSGDIVIMEGPARLSYHAIPKILSDSCHVQQYMVKLKRPLEAADGSSSMGSHQSEEARVTWVEEGEDLVGDITELNNTMKEMLYGLESTYFWDYLRTSRINLNIRQVLPEGQSFPAGSDPQPETYYTGQGEGT